MGDDDLDAQVWELHCQGLSVRQIADRLGVNKDKGHGIIKRLTDALAALEAEPDAGDEDPWSDEDWHDEDDGGKEVDLMDDLPPRPWTYHGTERVRLEQGRGERPKFVRGEVWTDANGQRVNFQLEAYRLRAYLEIQGNHHEASREAARSFDADCERQRDGYRLRSR
jgi:hypothetical protein